MSFILDALKKSETERQRQTGPGFATIAGGGQRKNLPRWAIALAALLLINLVVILAVALFPDKEPDHRPGSSPATSDMSSNRLSGTQPAQLSPQPAVQQTTQAKASSRPEVRSLAGEVEKSDNNTNTSKTPDVASNSSTQQGGFVVYQAAYPNVASSELPTLSDLRMQGLLSIPEMHMDIHVYGETESDRFVFINMRKYKKGESLKEGPILENILHDGVVLNEHGLRFFLPRD
jgi:general secretion pathway protein B